MRSWTVLHPPYDRYPAQYVKPWRLEDGTQVLIRPIRPEDEPSIGRFHARLSERSIYQRLHERGDFLLTS